MTSPEYVNSAAGETENWFVRCARYRPEVLMMPIDKVQPMFRARISMFREYLSYMAGIGYLERKKSSIDILGRYRGAIEYGRTMAIDEKDWTFASNRKGAYPIEFGTAKERRP